jgi:hypothetical protein
MHTASTYRINTSHVVHEIFEDGEAAIINLKSGTYYSLNPVGASIWSLIEQRRSPADIVARILQRYDGSLPRVTDDVNGLITSLQGEDLIAPDESGEDLGEMVPEAAPAIKVPYMTPFLERFDDMKELLLLDPIHEVGEAGWPHARSDKAR